MEADKEQRLGYVMLERVNNILEAAARKGRAEEGLKEAAGVGAGADRRSSSAGRGGCQLHQVRQCVLGCHYEEFSRILLGLVSASFGL